MYSSKKTLEEFLHLYCCIIFFCLLFILCEYSQLENAANDFVLHVEGVRLALREGTDNM
jgi:hypothetical protein